MNLTQDNKKLILMVALLAALGGVLYYNFFSEEDTPSTPNKSQSGQTAGKSKNPAPTPTPNKNELPVIDKPLELAAMTSRAQEPGAGRNIFVYPPPPTPTPPPPTPPPIPPPITLSGLNPAGVIGRTGDFTMTLFGAKFPSDAVVFIAGRQLKTTFVSDSQLKVTVPAASIANPGSLPVEVRGANDPKLFSNVFNLNVTPPPAPPYKYLGMIVKDGVTTAVVKFDLEEDLIYVRKDAILDRRNNQPGHWKLISITPQEIEIEDTNIKIRHRVPFSGEGS
ncbi:MAG TPA: IPT/TIG domain-containing protein [Blastocatellia bacterium]|nr:IPT/TIG domain-containing protein [Blastocatellia bacterium]